MAVERTLLPIIQKMLLCVPLRPDRPFSLSLSRPHLRLPRVSGESTTFFSIYARSMLFLTSLHSREQRYNDRYDYSRLVANVGRRFVAKLQLERKFFLINSNSIQI